MIASGEGPVGLQRKILPVGSVRCGFIGIDCQWRGDSRATKKLIARGRGQSKYKVIAGEESQPIGLLRKRLPERMGR